MHTRALWPSCTHALRAYASADTRETTGDRAHAHASSLYEREDIFMRTPAHPSARTLSRKRAQTPKDSQVQTCTRHTCTRGHAHGIARTRADDTRAHTHPTSAQDKCAGSSTQQLTHAHAIAIMKRARAHTLPHARSHTGVGETVCPGGHEHSCTTAQTCTLIDLHKNKHARTNPHVLCHAWSCEHAGAHAHPDTGTHLQER